MIEEPLKYSKDIPVTVDKVIDYLVANRANIGGIVVGIIAIAALIAIANGGGACTVEETTPEPAPEPCR